MVAASSARPALRLPAGLLPGLATAVFAIGLAATWAVAGSTLGYDFRAYHEALVRALAGQPLYDMAYSAAGGYGLFYYPPTFALLALPLGLLPVAVATPVWSVLLLAAFLVGIAILPVPVAIRWVVLLLAGLSWPFLYAMKLGQVGPLVLLAFAAGWRWLDRDSVVGAGMAAGAAIKVQPGLGLVWAILERRWRAVAVGVVVLLGLGAASLLAFGASAWSDFVTLVVRVADPISNPQNMTPGAVAYAAGLPREPATVLQWTSMALVLVAVVAGVRWCSPEASYLSIVPASQLLSPVLWDHYAMLLLVPVAWLLARRRWWAAIIPLATPVFLVGIIPPLAYPVAFWVTLVAVLVEGRRRRAPVAVA